MLALFYHIRSKKARIFHLFSNCCISTTYGVSKRSRKKVTKGKSFSKIGGDLYVIVHTFNYNRPDTRLILTRFDKMLRNEKYTGRVMLQKTVSSGAVQIENNGLMDRFLYTDTHEAIISDEMFMAVQQEKLSRAKEPQNHVVMMLSL